MNLSFVFISYAVAAEITWLHAILIIKFLIPFLSLCEMLKWYVAKVPVSDEMDLFQGLNGQIVQGPRSRETNTCLEKTVRMAAYSLVEEKLLWQN